MFGKSTTAGSLFNNTSTPTSTPTAPNNTLQKPFKAGGQGLFGNANPTAAVSTPSPSGNLLNGGANIQTKGNGLFGGTQANTTTGGLFGSNSTQNKGSGFAFGQNTAGGSGGGLFGTSSSSNGASSRNLPFENKISGGAGFSGSGQASGGLFSGTNATSSTGLFGNHQSLGNSTQGTFSFNNNVSNSVQTQPSFNPYGLNIANVPVPVSSMPASITAPAMDSKTTLDRSTESNTSFTSGSTAPNRRTYSISSTISNTTGSQVSLPATSKSSLINKLSARLKSAPNTSSTHGIFSPALDGQWNSQEKNKPNVKDITDSRESASKQKDEFPSGGFTPLSLQRGGSSDMRKLKIDPSRSIAKKLKLFTGESTPTKSHTIDQSGEEKINCAEGKTQKDEQQEPAINALTKDNDIPNQVHDHDELSDSSPPAVDNSGYWCSPSPEQLANLSEEQLTAVPNFLIGRKGYGSITFQYDVDLSAFAKHIETELFGKVVIFNANKTVEVYADESKKPPIGCGLNVPAIVTLNNVYPVDKKSKKELRDEANSNEVQVLVRRLRNLRNMDFISYNPFGGVWTFKVNHFSIWGLTNEEDAEIDEQEVKNAKAETIIDENFAYPNARRSLAQTKMDQEMLPGTFESQENGFSPAELPQRELIGVRQANNSDLESVTPRESDFLVEEKPYEPDINESDFEGMVNEPALNTSSNWVEQLQLAGSNLKSVFAEASDLSVDGDNGIELLFNEFNENLRKEKTAKKERRIVNFNFAKFSSDSSLLMKAPNRTSGVRSHIIPMNSCREPAFVEALFSKHFSLCAFTKRQSNNYPKVTGSQLLFSDIADLCSPSSVEYTLWTLCSVLFDEINLNYTVDDPSVEEALLKNERHKQICSWIVEQTKDEINARIENETDALEIIFLYLLKNDVANACKMALKSQNGHLAILLATLDSNDPRIRDLAAGQLERWRSCGQRVSPAIARIYRLLAGEEVNEKFLNEREKDSISWLALLGANLYYGKVNELSLKEVISLATRDPISNKHDFKYTIFKLYGLQEPIEFTFEELKNAVSPLDYSISWHIAQILRFGKEGVISDRMNDKLTSDYIGQLRVCQLHKEALFAASFYSDDSAAEQHIESIVYHEIPILSSASNKDMIQRLRIPTRLIQKAAALKHRYDGDYLREAQCLIKAEAFEEAERVVIESVGPMLIINGLTNNERDLTVLQGLLSSFPASEMKNWSTGLGVYDIYVKLKLGSNADKQLIDCLLDGVCLLYEAHKRCKAIPVCCSIISQYVAAQYLELEQHSAEKDDSYKEKLLKLPLGQPEKKYLESSLV
ncbi:hypothetical protein HG536_0A01630 [Torulaspora globosa]|uniref:Peptidase S59 domain-containing protein n=1 Tax=Torulaspora globosa TaxID=48254 RepID=A0A7G3ZA10_9SACH|nr:uncharacterized protein HG536_0A01630 [Torulaspora globosa]QLL30346.1 hypothetical protein HG536_0A01630 [Torulaspora globosa]